MKILIISDIGSDWGGSEELWSQSARELLGQGLEVHVSFPIYKALNPKVNALVEAGACFYFRQYPVIQKIRQRLGEKYEFF